MLNVQKEQKGDVLVVKLAGTIEETVDFDKAIGAPGAEIHLYLKEISRINSVGVKGWIKYFQGIASKGTKIKFFEVSSAIVEQMNLISNFAAGGTVESVCVPYAVASCTTAGCSKEFIAVYKSEDLKKRNFEVPELKCPRCAKGAEFDDLPEEYFAFLMR